MEFYIPTHWDDHIVDPVSGDVVQQGTRFTAKRANNIEEAIVYLMNTRVPYVNSELSRIYLELEMMGRSPVNNGTFFVSLDGGTGKQMSMLTNKAVLQNAISVGATTITIDTSPFLKGEVVTLTDEELSENVTINAVNGNVLTISGTTKAFKKGAFVTRSNTVIDTNTVALKFGRWSTYSVEVV